MYYLQSRYYNPEIGRFISGDVLLSGVGGSVQGCNIFAYCYNNPVNLYDPMGLKGNRRKSKFTHKSRYIGTRRYNNTHKGPNKYSQSRPLNGVGSSGYSFSATNGGIIISASNGNIEDSKGNKKMRLQLQRDLELHLVYR